VTVPDGSLRVATERIIDPAVWPVNGAGHYDRRSITSVRRNGR
jgi:hypothetical protein